MGSILRNSFFDHVLSEKILIGLFASITLINPVNAYGKQGDFVPLFEVIEENDLNALGQFFAQLERAKPSEAQCAKFLDNFLFEFNTRYQTNIGKEDWNAIAFQYIQKNAPQILCQPAVFEKIEVLLGLKQSFFKNCGYREGQNGEIDDHLVLGGVGLLLSGLIGTLGLVFTPALGVASAIATYSLYEISEGIKKQSEINRTNPNLYSGSFRSEMSEVRQYSV